MTSQDDTVTTPWDPLDRFVGDHHRRLATALSIVLDNGDLGLRAADRGLSWLSGSFDRHPGAETALVAAFDRGLAWARSSPRRWVQRLPWVDPDPEDPIIDRIADPVDRDVYRRSSAAEREAAVRSVLLGQPGGPSGDLPEVVAGLAGALAPPHTSVEAIIDLRGSARTARRLAVAGAVVALAAVVGLSAAMVAALRDDRVVTEVARLPVDGNEAAELRLVWDTRTSPIGFAPAWAIDGGTLYVLSTAPPNSVAAFQPALWNTTDGQNWSQRVLETSFNDGVTVFDGRLYVLSTAPEASGSDPEFELRVDELTGSGSRTLALGRLGSGFDVGDVGVQSFAQNFVGAGAGGVVVSTVLDGFIDFFQLMPAEFQRGSFWPDPRPDGLHIVDDSGEQAFGECMSRTMDEGMADIAELEEAAAASGDWQAVEQAVAELEALAAERCERIGGGPSTAAVIPWADLGLEGFDGENGGMLRSTATVHIDDPMAEDPTITDITAEVPPGAHLQHIRAVGDGFVAVAQSPRGGSQAGYSTDGRKWTFGDIDAGIWPISAGAVDGTPTVLSASQGGVSVAAFVDGAWTTLGDDAPGAADQNVITGGVGDLGLVAVYESFQEGEAGFVEERPVVADGGPIDGLLPGFPDSEEGGSVQQFFIRYSADGRTWVPVMITEPVPCCANPSVVAVGADRITITIGSWNSRQASRVVLAELDR